MLLEQGSKGVVGCKKEKEQEVYQNDDIQQTMYRKMHFWNDEIFVFDKIFIKLKVYDK